MIEIRKAVKSQRKLRMALIGPSGSGKTFSALAIARGLAMGKKICVIDTEHSSASLYADHFDFDTIDLKDHSPDSYVAAIEAASAAGYEVIIVDSLSHAWIGRGGALEMVDQATAKSRTGNSFGAWREVTPAHNRLVDCMIRVNAHLIACMRAKTDYVQEKDEKTGKTVIRKVGLAPIQRDGLEYEFDICGDLDHENRLIITKSRMSVLSGGVISKPGAELAARIQEWLNSGPPAVVEAPQEVVLQPVATREETVPAVERLTENERFPAAKKMVTPKQLGMIKILGKELNFTPQDWAAIKERFGVHSSSELTQQQASGLIDSLIARKGG